MELVNKGYTGKILWIDLTEKTHWIENITAEFIKKWVGGSGFAAAMMPELVSADTYPLGPENVIGYFTGPFTGTNVPSSGRHCVAAKSPLTNIWGEASIGGNFGKMLKLAGYDALLLKGRADSPVYIWIHEDNIEIRPADVFWGMDTYEIEGALRSVTHPKAQVSSIGVAGERLSKIAGVFSDGNEARCAARCGLGAVQGSKNVKAVAAYGNKTVRLHDKTALMASIREFVPTARERMKGMITLGTPGVVVPSEKLGGFPIKNWAEGSWEEGAAKINGTVLAEKYMTGRYHCAACVIGCGRTIKVPQGRWPEVLGGGPEYETLGTLGGCLLIDDLEFVCYANALCNRYGIDTIDTGNLIAFAMEAYEKGYITEKDTGGLAIKWGDQDVAVELIRQMGEVRGFGGILSQGFPEVKKRWPQTASFCMEVKGLSFPAHDPRAYNSIGLAYATSNRGCCHLEGLTHYFERGTIPVMPEIGITEVGDRHGAAGKGELVSKAQNIMAIYDSVGFCKFLINGGASPNYLARWLQYTTGIEWTVEDLMECGERIFNRKRMFNVSCGIDSKDDYLPERAFKEKRGSGGSGDNLPPIAQMLEEYYACRGWSRQGIPGKEVLDRLKI